MKHLHEIRTINHNIKHLFDIVLDIESYPEFLPWVTSAVIVSRETQSITADLTASFAGVVKSYRSNVDFEYLGENAWITAESHNGLFRSLMTKWSFRSINGQSTEVDFTIEFELFSKIMTNLVGPVILDAQKKIIAAFELEAKKRNNNANK